MSLIVAGLAFVVLGLAVVLFFIATVVAISVMVDLWREGSRPWNP